MKEFYEHSMENFAIEIIEPVIAEKICRQLTLGLSEWFGIPEANERYAKGCLSRTSFAAFLNNKYIGLVVLEFPFPNNANIYWMAVDKAYHNQKIGQQLLQAAENYCFEQNILSLTVETLSPNQNDSFYLKTYQFYEKYGFKPLFELQPYGPALLMCYLQKPISYQKTIPLSHAQYKNCIIYLIGFSGVGKLTIAKEIVSNSNFKLVDNHLINNPILSVIETDGKTPLPKSVWEKIGIIRDTVHETIAMVSSKDSSFIFTNELVDGKNADIDLYKKVERIALKRGSHFLPVCLICEEAELCKRIGSYDRKANFKDCNVEAVHQKMKSSSVLIPSHPNTFTLEVTSLSAEKACNIILEKLKALIQDEHTRC